MLVHVKNRFASLGTIEVPDDATETDIWKEVVKEVVGFEVDWDIIDENEDDNWSEE